jgi:glycosyltransferase involved in cell wall biosynthesis
VTRPLVSAIITTKDRPGFLARSIASVFAQSYPELELIVVDDGSAKPITLDATNAGDIPVTILRNERPAGVSAARNVGVRTAAGRFVAFLDDDDQWTETKIAQQIERLTSVPGRFSACGCQLTIVDENGAHVAEPNRPYRREEILSALTLADENLPPSTLVFDRQCFLKLDGFREDMPAAEDREFLLRYLMQRDIVILPERLVRITEHKGERLTRTSHVMLAGELKYLDFIAENIHAFGVGRKHVLGYRHAKVGHEAMLAREWRTGMKYFFQGLLRYPFDKRVVGGALLSLLGPQMYRRLIAVRMARVR